MARKFLMVLLGIGAVAGFGAGFARLFHHGFGHGHHAWGHHGPGGKSGRHAAFERHIADTCADAALRVYGKQGAASPNP